jgi:hypothetical protein
MMMGVFAITRMLFDTGSHAFAEFIDIGVAATTTATGRVN